MATESTSSAKKRLDRLVTEHADELLSLSRRQRERVMDAAWIGGKPTAAELISKFRTERSQASARSAATKLMNRKHGAAEKVVQTMGARLRNPRQTRINAPMLSLDQVREIEKKESTTLVSFIERQAAKKPPKGERNPLWYR